MSLPALPRLGLGAGPLGDAALDDDAARAVVHAALDEGLTLFDTARGYGSSEERLGRLLEGRRDVVVATKGGYGVDGAEDWTREAVRLGVDRALRLLRVEAIGVFFLHSCPLSTLHRDEILLELDRAMQAGKILARGYSGDGEALAWAARSGRFDAVECSVNVVDQEALASAGIVPTIAKRALLNGAYLHDRRPDAHDVATYFDRLRAAALDPSPLAWPAFALRFAAFAPGVACALVGTRRAEHVRAAARAVREGPLDEATVARIRAAWDPSWRGVI